MNFSPPSAPVLTPDQISDKFLSIDHLTQYVIIETEQEIRDGMLHALNQQLDDFLGSDTKPGLTHSLRKVREEDDLPPMQRANRVAVVDGTTPLKVLDANYRLYEALGKITPISSEIASKIRVVLGHMNNYQPYVNVRGVLERKEALLRIYAGPNATREQRIAMSAVMVLDTISAQQQIVGIPELKRHASRNPYGDTLTATQDYLDDMNARDAFHAMGFRIPVSLDEYQTPANHPSLQRAMGLSDIPQEYTFVVLHQMFEAIFEDGIRILDELDQSNLSEADVNAKLHELSMMFKATRRLYPVLGNLLERKEFLAIRSNGFFGVASGAQSLQYHIMEARIGLPHDDAFARSHGIGLRFILGKDDKHHVDQQMKGRQSLKEKYATPTSYAVANALRELNMEFMRFKTAHSKLMLQYLYGYQKGTAGQPVAAYFANSIGPIFPVFTDEEKAVLAECTRKASDLEDPFKHIDHYLSDGAKGQRLADTVPSNFFEEKGTLATPHLTVESIQ